MAQPSRFDYTIQEYLWEEQRSETKRDFYNGRVYAMAGGSPNHSRIATDLLTELTVALRGKECEAFNSDLKIGVTTSNKPKRKGRTPNLGDEDFVTYPDGSIVCGKLDYYKGDRNTIANPTYLVEVLSPSTRNYDRVFKLEQYQKIPSLKTYVMIDSEKIRVEYYSKIAKGQWLQGTLTELEDLLLLEELGISIALSILYARVKFNEDEE